MNKPVFIELTHQGTGKPVSVNPAHIAVLDDGAAAVSCAPGSWALINSSGYTFAESKAEVLRMIETAYGEGGGE